MDDLNLVYESQGISNYVCLKVTDSLSRFQVNRAGKNLLKAGIIPVKAVLFRMSYKEIKEFAAKKVTDIPDSIAEKARYNPRWAVIAELIKRSAV